MRLIQYYSPSGDLSVGIVQNEEEILTLEETYSMYELAWKAIDHQTSLEQIVSQLPSGEVIGYSDLVEKKRIAVPCLHADPAHVLVSGTGLTHLGSANTRNNMHAETQVEHLTDSMRMFEEGKKYGKPASGRVGAQPEWFYKGNGDCLTPPYHPLESPDFGSDIGEEPEIVGIYLIGPGGQPYRLGFALGNEASDHIIEKQNYLLLAHSKLRNCSVGPELRLGEFPDQIRGTSKIRRNGKVLWEKEFLSGSAFMSHSIENLEYHHFKYSTFRKPGDLHFHFFGTSTLSFADGVRLEEDDEVDISADGWGKALRNTIRWRSSDFLRPQSL